jgi:hypothetical protein
MLDFQRPCGLEGYIPNRDTPIPALKAVEWKNEEKNSEGMILSGKIIYLLYRAEI